MFDGATRAPDETARGEYSTDLFTRKAVEAIDAHFGPQHHPREAIDARPASHVPGGRIGGRRGFRRASAAAL